MATFGDALRAIREERGFSRADLLDRLAVSKTTLERWEYGQCWPNYESQCALAAALGCYIIITIGGSVEFIPAEAMNLKERRHD